MVESTVPHVSVVIPVLNAQPWLADLLGALMAQKPYAPQEIILVDSGSTDGTLDEARRWPAVKVIPIARFTHGGARNLGARKASGDLLFLLTQDARPADEHVLARLVAALDQSGVVAAYARQIPRDDAHPMEQYFLADRFPAGPPVVRRAVADRPLLVEDVFFSNVAALIRRSVLLQYPFDETLIMSEDQQFSRDVLLAGKAVAYAPDAVVIHSHNYTLGVCLRRYFDSVYSLRLLFHGHGFATTWRMGWGYQWRELSFMVRKYPLWLPYYVAYCSAKILGTLASHFAEHMPRKWARAFSLHRYYWSEEKDSRHAAAG